MQKDYLFLAIRSLKPNSEFNYKEQDYSSVQWDVLEGQAPTQIDIDAAIEKIKAEEAQVELDRATKKAAAEAKLEVLGLTADDLKALGL